MNIFKFFVLIVSLLFFIACQQGSPSTSNKNEDEREKTRENVTCKRLADFSSSNDHVLDCSKGSNIELHLYPLKGFNLISWLDISDDADFVSFTRKLAQLADHFKLNKGGFSFSGGRGDDHFVLSADLSANVNNERITLDMASLLQPAPEFKEYIEKGVAYSGPNANDVQVRATKRSTSFYSLSKNRLIVPNKNYLTIYHFARDASDDEIIDFWNHIAREAINQNPDVKGPLALHTGSKYGQTVPHVHFRLEK